MKPPARATRFRIGMDTNPHLQTRDSCKLSHMSGYAPRKDAFSYLNVALVLNS